MFYNILDKKRLNFLPLFKKFKKEFYLAGGTALALQIGHRDSLDFDFFSVQPINTKQLFEKLQEIFKRHKIAKVQEDKNTLSLIIDEKIKLSFFTYKYKLMDKLIKAEYFNLASVVDIGCMKLSTLISRATNKDYVDLYYILKKVKLPVLLLMMEKKFSNIDLNLVLKSIVFFDDIEKEPLRFKNSNRVSFSEVKEYLQEQVKKIY